MRRFQNTNEVVTMELSKIHLRIKERDENDYCALYSTCSYLHPIFNRMVFLFN
jgi:hypothetical protein